MTLRREPLTSTFRIGRAPAGGVAETGELLRSKEPSADTTRTESSRTPSGIVMERENVPLWPLLMPRNPPCFFPLIDHCDKT